MKPMHLCRPRLSGAEIRHLIRRAQAGDLQARDEVCLANMALVGRIASRFRCHHLEYSDLVQEGVVGLLRAIDKFDLSRNLQLSTFATVWIRQAISRAIENQERVMRLPPHACASLRAVKRADLKLQGRLGRAATLEELSAQTGLPRDKVLLCQQHALDTLSLNELVGNKEDAFWGDLFPDLQTPGPEAELLSSEDVNKAWGYLDELPERWAWVMRGRLAGRSLQELGDEQGVSKETIRMIEKRATQQLQKIAAREAVAL